MLPSWFKPRSYRHVDVAVGQSFVQKVLSVSFVASHSFSPLISYNKVERRYKKALKKTVFKYRPIMYASHRDSCIYSYYSFILSKYLEAFYTQNDIDDNVIAYRSLGKSNYHFANEALLFARQHQPCVVLAFDVSKFFDTLDHSFLKRRLKQILNVAELPADWFVVFKNVTKYHHITRDSLLLNEFFSKRSNQKSRKPIATIAEVKAEGIEIHANPNKYGIPQGTPISSVLANLYMKDFDLDLSFYAKNIGGFYRRYSDDIIIICSPDKAGEAEEYISLAIQAEKLEVSLSKTEKTLFEPGASNVAQYLGFDLHWSGAAIRPGSLSRQYRKMRRAVKRTTIAGGKSISSGKSDKIYTKKLWQRFSSVQSRNFSSYGRKSAENLESVKIKRQIKRFESAFRMLLKKSNPT